MSLSLCLISFFAQKYISFTNAFLHRMHSHANFSVLALAATLLTSTSLGLTLPIVTDQPSYSERSTELDTHQDSCQPPYPEHYGPQSCPKAHENPWAGHPPTIKPSYLELFDTGSNETTGIQDSRLIVIVDCRLVAVTPFVHIGTNILYTSLTRFHPNFKYLFAWCGQSVVSRVRAFQVLSGGGYYLLANSNPNAASGSLSISSYFEPRIVVFEVMFLDPTAHIGTITLYETTYHS